MAPRRNALPTVDFESTGNRARNAAGGNPGVSGFNNRTTTDLAAGFGALTDMVQRIQLERDTVKAVGEESRITTETAAAQAKLNPLDPDYQKQVADLWSGAKKQVMESGISSPAVLDDISKRMDRHGASMQIAAIGEVKTATSKKAELTYKDAVDATNAKIRNDPANANLYTDELKADTERLKIGMDPIAFEVVSRKAADELAKNQIIGYAEKGNFGAARNALKAQAPHLDTGAVTACPASSMARRARRGRTAIARARPTPPICSSISRTSSTGRSRSTPTCANELTPWKSAAQFLPNRSWRPSERGTTKTSAMSSRPRKTRWRPST
jgi:hypothetical protein